MRKIKSYKFSQGLKLFLAVFLLLTFVFSLPSHSSAATLTSTALRLDRMKTGTGTSWELLFKPASSGATAVSVNFGAGWTVNGTQTAAGCTDQGATSPTVSSPTGSGNTASATVGSLTGGTLYCIKFTSATSVTTPSAGNTYYPVVTVGSDSQTVGLDVISNDQISLTATVVPAFTFGISSCGGGGNTDTFTGNLTAGAVTSTSGCTLSVSTNSKSGWYLWAADLNSPTGLNSASASHAISWSTAGSQTDLSGQANSEGYVFAINSYSAAGSNCYSSCGTISAVAAYDDSTAHTSKGGGLDGTYRSFISSNGVQNAWTMVVKERATINPTTPPGTDYTDSITVVGAGNF